LIRLPSGLVRGPELLFLLIQYFTAAIGPTRGLIPRLPGAITNELAAVLGSRAQRLPGFVAGAWSIQHAGGNADT
jgi:hypothetical protein